MSYLFKAIINLIDFFYQKKIINFFKKNMDSNMQLLLDIGSHKGETIEIFLKNFNIKKGELLFTFYFIFLFLNW